MITNMKRNKPITLRKAQKYFPVTNGRKVHTETIKRRIKIGVRGVFLGGFKSGNMWFTTRGDIEKFQSDCTRNAKQNKSRPKAEREKASQFAQTQLQKQYGFSNVTEENNSPEQATS